MKTEHRGRVYEITPAHPVAELFPWLSHEELDDLADDIAANGQRQPVVKLADGRLADGRNRELACRIAGVEPKYVTLPPLDESQVVARIVSANLFRRHLTPSQRAMVAAGLETYTHGGNRKVQDAPVHLELTRAQAAEQLGVSERSVASAAKVRDDAPELVPPVLNGTLDVKTAAAVADLPTEDREAVAAAPDPKEEAARRLPPWMKPGYHGDPDHPFADLLNKFTALSAALTRAITDPDNVRLLETLTRLSEVTRKTRMVDYQGTVIDRGEVKGGKTRFVGLAPLRNVIRRCGLLKKPMTTEQIAKALDEEGDE